MATNRSINPNLNTTSDRIAAFFQDRNNAYKAITELKKAGFKSDEIGMAVADDYSDQTNSAKANLETRMEGKPVQRTSETGEHDRSFWQGVKDFFTGEDYTSDENHDSDFHSSTSGMGWNDDRTNYYHQGIRSGGALLTVSGARSAEARVILERCGGDLRETGFDTSSFRSSNVRDISGKSNVESANRGDIDADRRIQLRGEMLRAQKERVQRGEVRLRKEVVTENKTIEVPVTREELVIERNAAPSGTRATGEIGGQEEIRVPLSEERVRIDKEQVVNEEVRVGKRQVQRTEQVSGQERHEELRVEKDSDVEADTDINTGRKKRNPAA